MSKFDTHGGYFAPKDYMRVNEGGSHEENPNGGVQIGVDPEGNPNLLEEGEPVYKDYVYSDNIEAEREFLEQNNLPGKYAGKLYSKIADDLFSEAEERPLDPISRNGLEALLGRLADAQEGQKQAKEQRDLENELAQLSPEELDQLEAMLAQEQFAGTDNPMYGEGPVGAQGEPGIPPEQMMGPSEPMPVGGMPMMANGGKIARRFDDGGDVPPGTLLFNPETGTAYNPYLGGPNDNIPMLVDENGNLVDYINPSVSVAYPGKTQAWVDAQVGPQSIRRQVAQGRDQFLADAAETAYASTGHLELVPGLNVPAGVARGAYEVATGDPGGWAHMAGSVLLGNVDELKGLISQYKTEKTAAETAVKEAREVLKTGKNASGDAVGKDVAKKMLESAKEKLRFASRELKRLSGKLPKEGKAPVATSSAVSATEQTVKPVEAATKTATEDAPNLWKALANPLYGAGKQTAKALSGKSGLVRYPAATAAQLGQWGSGYAIYRGVDKAFDTWKNPFAGEPSYEGDEQPELDFGDWEYARGGHINRFDDGGWAEFLKRLADYGYSKNPAAVAGKYAIDRRADVWGGKTARDIEADKAYQDFTNYVIANSNNADVRDYLRALDAGVAKGTPLLFDGDNLVDGWEKLFRDRRTDGNLGIYHLNPDNIDFSNRFATAVSLDAPAGFSPLRSVDAGRVPFAEVFPGQYLADTMYRRYAARQRAGLIPGQEGLVSDDGNDDAGNDEYEGGPGLLPTWPRYAGAVGSGLLGLYNVFQQPDRYTAPHINPQLPEGRINLQNQVYNPVDQNMITNAQIAQGNATNRALRNSGLGPSSAAAILAADNNTTGNLGTGFLQTWDANNQRRNAVIAANNQAEAQRAQFDYTVDAARKQILNDTAYKNAYNDLMLQRLNYAAEGDKYQAISNQISNGLQALSGIGKENFAMNQINTNPAFLGYGVNPYGGMYYNPITRRYEKIEPEETVTKKTAAPVNTALKPIPTFGFNPNPKYSNDPFMGYNKGIDLTFNPLFSNKKKN